MDTLTVVISSLSALVVGLITAYITNRFTAKREKEKQERLLAERFTELSEEDAGKAEKLAKQFAVAFLVYLPEGSKHREKVFIPSSGRILVGRSKYCDLILKDRSVSRQHAIFEAQGSHIILRDIGSSTGIYVNGRKIPPSNPAQLKDGDKIRIGLTDFVFHKM